MTNIAACHQSVCRHSSPLYVQPRFYRWCMQSFCTPDVPISINCCSVPESVYQPGHSHCVHVSFHRQVRRDICYTSNISLVISLANLFGTQPCHLCVFIGDCGRHCSITVCIRNILFFVQNIISHLFQCKIAVSTLSQIPYYTHFHSVPLPVQCLNYTATYIV